MTARENRAEVQGTNVSEAKIVACAECFSDQGIKLMALDVEQDIDHACPVCGSQRGRGITDEGLEFLAYIYFERGTLVRVEYGGAPVIKFNRSQRGDINAFGPLRRDVDLIQKLLGIGFFYYGPRLWMVGEVEPLKRLQHRQRRPKVIREIIAAYPDTALSPGELFYRLRTAVDHPADVQQYDAPPEKLVGGGRLDDRGSPVLYGSQDLEVCIHECRVSAEDEIHVATLEPTGRLKLLDLTVVLEEDCTEFESLDMAVHMLFLAGRHAYPITRDLARALAADGYDGVLYPSYFSMLRTGAIPFETVYGISNRRMSHLVEHERGKIVPNIALFGRPVADGRVAVRCINRVLINRVAYGISFGPAEV